MLSAVMLSLNSGIGVRDSPRSSDGRVSVSVGLAVWVGCGVVVCVLVGVRVLVAEAVRDAVGLGVWGFRMAVGWVFGNLPTAY
jgi:hypothetical protein